MGEARLIQVSASMRELTRRQVGEMEKRATPVPSSHLCLLAQRKSIGVTLWLVCPQSALELQWEVAEVETRQGLCGKAGASSWAGGGGRRMQIWCPQLQLDPERRGYSGAPCPERKLMGGKGWGGSQARRVLWWKTG